MHIPHNLAICSAQFNKCTVCLDENHLTSDHLTFLTDLIGELHTGKLKPQSASCLELQSSVLGIQGFFFVDVVSMPMDI